MTLQDLGNLGEFIGAVAVVVSLGYVAYQLRQNTRQMADHSRSLRLAAFDATANQFSKFREPLIRDPQLANLWLRARKDLSDLSPEEQVQAGMLFHELFFAHQAIFMRTHEGAMEREHWERQTTTIRGDMRNPGVQAWWSRANRIFDPRFVSAVDEIKAAVAEPAA
jgi:hypothetical protein